MNDVREPNAYRYPQQIRPGCQHQLGCRCDPPFWLRESTAAEEAVADRIYGIADRAEQDAAT